MVDLRRSISPYVALLGSIVLVLFIAVTDYITGSELSFSIFYLIPISFVTLMTNKWIGFSMSILSAASWFLADALGGSSYSNALVPYWNTFVRFGYFLVHTSLLAALQRMIETQASLSRHDPLTGAANWRHMEEIAAREIDRARRSQKPLTFCYLDLDNFKTVNDSQGHEVGDEVLQRVVETIEGQIRATDLLARLGGDEFALLLPETDFEPSNAILERIQTEVIREMEDNDWPVTLSMGATTFWKLPSSVDSMVRRSDNLMYTVKNGGKNSLLHVTWPGQSS